MPMFFFDRDGLDVLAQKNREAFATSTPFHHVVIDDLLPADVLDGVIDEFPAPDHGFWRVREDAHQIKLGMPDDSGLGGATRQLLAQFNSQQFLDFLTALTGIPNLIVDPHYVGGGLHQIQPGGFLKVHKDFSVHRDLKLLRRLNVIVYLNKDWPDEYGGHFELWNEAVTTCESKVAPIANRAVIFDTINSYHGHPEPLTCPPDRTRRSMALYYYTLPEAGQALPDGLVVWGRRPQALDGSRWAHLARDWTPPVLYRKARQAKARRRAAAGNAGG